MAVRYDEQRKRWLVEFEQAHVRVFRRLPKGSTATQAQSLETKLRREIFDRETLEKIPALSLEKAIEQWLLEDHRRKDRRKMASEARQWEPFAKGRLLREVPEVVQEAMKKWEHTSLASRHCHGGNRGGRPGRKLGSASMTKSGDGSASSTDSARQRNTAKSCANSTINRRLAMLKSVCRHAYKQGRIAENVSGRITVLPELNQREVYLTRAQVKLLMKCAPSLALRAAIGVAAWTGLRASELLGLTHTSTHGDTIMVATSKSGKPRVVPVPKPAQRYLSALPLALSYWQLHKQFLVARKKARMPYLRFHDLRHTCASWLINAGVDLYTVGKILGHSGPQTTQRYAHLSHASLKAAMDRLK